MKRDFKQSHKPHPGRSVTIKRIQVVRAPMAGITTMGTPYKKGFPIIHLSSSRSTGETWVFTRTEWAGVLGWITGNWNSPKKWSASLHKIWITKYQLLLQQEDHKS